MSVTVVSSELPPHKLRYKIIRISKRRWPLALCAFLAGFLTVSLLDLEHRLFSFGISLPDLQFYSGHAPLSERQIYSAVIDASRRYRVPSELVLSVISAESDFRHRIRSRRGAMGLMQLSRDVARGYGVSDPFDPMQNVNAGTAYLSQLIRNYNGNWELALAAYNAGPGAVSRYRGIPPYPETRNYVKKVMNEYRKRSRAREPIPRG